MLKKTFFLFLLVSFYSNAQQQFYELRDYVTDSADVFTPDQVLDLNQRLSDFEEKTTNQFVVVTIEELGFDTIESYANGLFNQNGIGQKGKDNGLLILFSESDREVRIEVGYGLEPYITDAVASRIIRNTMIPNFKEGDYFKGVNEASNQLIQFLNDPDALAEFKQEIEDDGKKGQFISYVFMGIFLLIFISVGGFFFFKTYKNIIEVFRGIFMGKLGVVPGLFMLIAGSFSSVFSLVFVIVPLVVVSSIYEPDRVLLAKPFDEPSVLFWLLVPFFGIAAIIAFVKLKISGKEDLSISWLKNDETYYRKTFSSSGTHSFSSGSSGGSSGSFSGGGGSSGGGGASGSW
ncbi:TPM domain-containing protein [Maribacter sp. TH_r10]|uniref:TPM domain-containing protein n=1 Tax=Maribacter sp. TH_r10 TaxID=3082086 RepID=UPI002952D03F|nr:TPM domain-containing protein [Maribacter sp. TH_r10]MDV7138019.1 TPM domain-containing protein [Maribacter sp. TH_r10]